MSKTIADHPIFDQVNENFEKVSGFKLFTVVHEEGEIELTVPQNVLPNFEDFSSSYPNEWLLYHNEEKITAHRMHAWTGQTPAEDLLYDAEYFLTGASVTPRDDEMQQILSALRNRGVVMLPAPEEDDEVIERRTMAEALKMVAPTRDNTALDTALDAIIGSPSEQNDRPIPKKFNELETEDIVTFIQAARDHLLDVHNYSVSELTPDLLVSEAERMYEESPIQIYHPWAPKSEQAPLEESIEEPTMVDLAPIIEEGIESGLIEVIAEEPPRAPTDEEIAAAKKKAHQEFWSKKLLADDDAPSHRAPR